MDSAEPRNLQPEVSQAVESDAASHPRNQQESLTIITIPVSAVETRLQWARPLSPIYAGAFSREPWREDLRAKALRELEELAKKDRAVWLISLHDFGGYVSPVGAVMGYSLSANPEIMGFVDAIKRQEGTCSFLAEIFVHEGFEGCGIASGLLKSYEKRVQHLGGDAVFLTTAHAERCVKGSLREFYLSPDRGYGIFAEPISVKRDPVPRSILFKEVGKGALCRRKCD